MNQFRTHTGEIVTGQRLQDALNKVADEWTRNAKAIRSEDEYASHVTEETKDDCLLKGLNRAEEIRIGNINSFTAWQDINTSLTGECVALLPK